MANFLIKEAEVFKIAALVFFFDLLPVFLIRFFLLLATFSAGISLSFRFLGIFALLLAFEIFYYFKIKNFAPHKKLAEVDNLAQACNLESAIAILKGGTATGIFQNLVRQDFGREFLARSGIKLQEIEKLNITADVDLAKLVETAFEFAGKVAKNLITPTELLIACFKTLPQLSKIAFDNDLKEEDLAAIGVWVDEIENERKRPLLTFDKSQIGAGIAQNWASGYTLETEKYAVDVTHKMTKGELKPYLVGREKELATIEEILARDAKKNVILVGEAGVGKSAIVMGLAKKSFEGSVLPPLRYKRVLELNLPALLAGAGKGVLEARVAAVISEIEQAGDVVLFVPNIEAIAGADVDISQLLLPVLGGTKVQVIATTTARNYVNFVEPRAEFAENFEKVVIEEPNFYQAVIICQKAATKIEKGKGVVISYKAVLTAVKLSDRYMKDRILPGKAIDLLDQAAVKVASLGRNEVLEDDIVNLISEKTKIPLEIAAGLESQKLLNLEKILHARVINQNAAIEAISGALRRARAKVRQETKPIGSFLFLGPTGVGKTETARALATTYFGGEDKIIRLDMSEFQTQESVSRLIGQGVGKGQLTEAVRAKPFSEVLLDEAEKANKSVIQLFLQVFDEGRLTDASGVTVDFTQTIIIATSNAGAEDIRQQILAGKNLSEFKKQFLDKLLERGVFSTEFLNRFTEIVLFRPLTGEELLQVASLIFKKLSKNLEQREIQILPTDNLLSYLVEKGYDQVFGARPLQRLVEDKVENLIAKKILEGELKRGEKVTVDVENGEVVLKKS